MKKNLLPVLGFLAFLFLFSCCQTAIHPVRPEESYDAAVFTPPVSTINIPVELDVRKLGTHFNNRFRGVIYEDTSFTDNENDNLKLKVIKRENITFFIEGNELSYRVPLYVTIKKKFELGAFGYSVSDTKEASASIVLRFKTKVSVGRDWSLTSYTTSDGYEWITTPVLKLGPVSLPLPVISDILVESNLETINREIDKAVRSALDLRAMVEKSWIEIQKPMQLSATPPLWLVLTPQEAATTPIQGTGNVLRQMVGVRVIAELYYGGVPDQQATTALPPLKITSRLDEGVSIGLVSDIPFEEINTLARQQLAGTTFTQGKYTVRVEDVQLFGNGPRLVLAANVSGSVKGTVFLAGTPWFDTLTSTLRLRDVDFDIRSKNVLIKSASWMLRGGIIARITSALAFPAGEFQDQVHEQIRKYLSADRQVGVFTVNGTLDRLDLDRIMITKESVKVLFIFTGKLNLGLAGK